MRENIHERCMAGSFTDMVVCNGKICSKIYMLISTNFFITIRGLFVVCLFAVVIVFIAIFTVLIKMLKSDG
jgi:hypothetical protein